MSRNPLPVTADERADFENKSRKVLEILYAKDAEIVARDSEIAFLRQELQTSLVRGFFGFYLIRCILTVVGRLIKSSWR
jgi:hypothetical protein